MCGIAGHFGDWRGQGVGEMLDRIAHRGPDGRGVLCHEGLTHGHVRLSVIDLTSASAQPFCYRDGILSYNGECWNFRALRIELQALGHEFKTSGDTEVVAAALSEWGERAFERLEGMFALAWSSPGKAILARDRFGKIPIYAVRVGRSFAWASERKGLTLGGAIVLVEKVLGATADLDELMVRRYHEFKRSNGYDHEAIQRKALSLEGVLVPVTARWNEDLLRAAGYADIDCFWRWMNFAAWVGIRPS